MTLDQSLKLARKLAKDTGTKHLVMLEEDVKGMECRYSVVMHDGSAAALKRAAFVCGT